MAEHPTTSFSMQTGRHSNSRMLQAAKQFCCNMDVTGEFFSGLAILDQIEVFRQLGEWWNMHIWEPNQGSKAFTCYQIQRLYIKSFLKFTLVLQTTVLYIDTYRIKSFIDGYQMIALITRMKVGP